MVLRMDVNRILEYCNCLGTVGKVQGARVLLSCIFAKWEHEGGTDNNPSSTISIKEHGESYYRCWSCGTQGNLHKVILDLKRKKAKDPVEIDYNIQRALELIADEEEDAELHIPDFEDVEVNSSASTAVWHDDFLASFMPIKKSKIARDYVLARDVPPKLAMELKLVFDTSESRVCFPLFDFDGHLVGLRGRALDPANKLRYKAYKYYGSYNMHVWLGEDSIDLDEPVILTESVFDYASIKRVYPNVLASLTSGISVAQFKRITGVSEIITLYDYDKGGDSARDRIDKYMSEYPIQHILPPEKGMDAGDMTIPELIEALGGIVDVEDIYNWASKE
jgi:DNA primase